MEDIELRDVKIAKDFYVPKDKVKYYAAYSGEFIINDVRKMRKTEPGKVTNATFGKKIMSFIFFSTGDLIIISYTCLKVCRKKKKKTEIIQLVFLGILIGIVIGFFLGVLYTAFLQHRKVHHKRRKRDLYDDLDDFEKIYNPQNLSGDKSIMDRSRRDHSADEYRSETK